MTRLIIKNPFSGEQLEELSFATPQTISHSLETAVKTFQKWKNSSAWERSQILDQVAAQLESEKEEFSNLIRKEAGKPIQLARAEVNRAIGVLRWASGEAQRFSGELLRTDISPAGRPGFGIHTRFPRGVVLGITPFNFPLNLVMHKVAPAIACGCTIIIKPSPYTPLTAIKLQKLFDSISPGLIQVVLADAEATAKLTQALEIAKISFTGSSQVGWLIRKQAPEKPTTLELGGNAWVIVMEDTPRELFPSIAKRITNAAFGYAGQSCISVQNIAVASPLWSDLEKQLKIHTETISYGDPSLESVISGPVIHRQAADRIREQLFKLPRQAEVRISVRAENLDLSLETVIPPTLITFSDEGDSTSALVQNEIFAPVVTARKFEELPKLIQKINSSPYGLQAGVYTQNWPAIETLYRELQVGGLVVNDVPTTRYDHQPYGGVKDSGQGREGVRYAMEEMTESKFLSLSSYFPK